MKDIIIYSLISLAILMSAAALIFGVIFQRKERKRGIRTTLTNSLNLIARVNVEVSHLKKDKIEEDPGIIEIRRNFDSQRNILLIDADFLIHENSKLSTAIDCALMASTYDDIGNFEKAEYYWKESIPKSENKTRKHINTRNYASFLFHRNKREEGREEFEKAFKIKLADTDDDWCTLTDSYILWAKLEHEFDGDHEAKHLFEQAYQMCHHIIHKRKHEDMKLIVDLAGGKKRTVRRGAAA